MKIEDRITFDQTDIEILNTWQVLLGYDGIARLLTVQEERVAEGIRKLQQSGIIDPQTGQLRYEAFGWEFRAMLTISVNPLKAATMVERLLTLSQVLSIRRLRDESIFRYNEVYMIEAIASSKEELKAGIVGMLRDIDEHVVIQYVFVEEVLKAHSMIHFAKDEHTGKNLPDALS